MKIKNSIVAFALLILTTTFASTISAQTKRTASNNYDGVYKLYFKGRFKNFANEIVVKSRGKNKLFVGFDLIHPYIVGGEETVNMGETGGEAILKGNTAYFDNTDQFGNCKITLKFVKPDTLVVTQETDGYSCAFGNNVTARGTYKKSRAGTKPR
ncbi:MAG: hypothetical protein H7Z37_07795 [Pyrinomonadaceae bacterium]|nr:hypothetical protein [Pyrinomonadaceae bacterium]